MASRKPANPNTAYGRKRIIKEAQQYNRQLTPKQIEEGKNFSYIMVGLAIAIILIIVFLIGGIDGVKYWISPKGLR